MGNIAVKKVDTNPKLNFWEKIWLLEIIRGLWITNKHFMVNINRHILNAFGIKTKEKGAVTIQYPEEIRGYHHRLRTRHYLAHKEDGSTRCVGCMMCETVCPAKCIYIVAEEVDDPNVEKRPREFTIDMGKCIYCGYCVDACPEDAIRMDSGDLEISAYTRGEMIHPISKLMENGHKPKVNYKDYDEYLSDV